MFNKLKAVKDMRSRAKQMQNALNQIILEHEKNGIKIKLNGNLEFISISLPTDATPEQLEKKLVEACNSAVKKAQMEMSRKIQEMGGLPNFNF